MPKRTDIKKILIIGAGISGLSAGCYARMNGYDTEIYEMHSIPGGLCTSWKRGGYTFDGCVHWLMGSGKGSPFNRFWNELGVLEGTRFIDHEEFFRFEDRDGRNLIIYTDVDRLEKHLKELSPIDSPVTEELCSLIRKFSKRSFPMDKAPELYNFFDSVKMMLKMGPVLKEMIYCLKTSIKEFASRYQDPLIRENLVRAIHPDTSLIALVLNLAVLNQKSAGFPLGGSLEFAKKIEKKFLSISL